MVTVEAVLCGAVEMNSIVLRVSLMSDANIRKNLSGVSQCNNNTINYFVQNDQKVI